MCLLCMSILDVKEEIVFIELLVSSLQEILLVDFVVDKFDLCGKVFGKLEIKVCNQIIDGVFVWMFEMLKIEQFVVMLMVYGMWCIL